MLTAPLVKGTPFDHRDASDSGEQRSLDARLVCSPSRVGAAQGAAVGERAERERVVRTRAAQRTTAASGVDASVELRGGDLDGARVKVDEVIGEVQASKVRAGHVHDALHLSALLPPLLLLLAAYSRNVNRGFEHCERWDWGGCPNSNDKYTVLVQQYSPAEALRDRDLEAGGSSMGGSGAAGVNPAASSAFACETDRYECERDL